MSSAFLKASSREMFPSPEAQKPLIGNDDQGVHHLSQFGDSRLRLAVALFPLKLEGFRHDRHGQRADFSGDFRRDRRASGSRASAEARGDEDHIGSLEVFAQRLPGFEGRLPADVGVRTGAQPLGGFGAQLDLDRRGGCLQRLRIGVGRDEIDPPQVVGDHRVDRISARAADADHLDRCRAHQTLIRQFEHNASPP